jgi:hypothetical protein
MLYRAAIAAAVLCAAAPAAEPWELVRVRKVWDRATHCAFTDLLRLDDRWLLAFREGKGHVSPDGAIRVLTSTDGVAWQSAALLTSTTADLRDPKLSRHPDGRAVLCAGAALHDKSKHTHESSVWLSKDGRDWGQPKRVAGNNEWLWRQTWHDRSAYGFAYGCGTDHYVALYRGNESADFQPLVARAAVAGEPNEAALIFLPDDTAVALLRRDGPQNSALLGTSKPPYTEWTWKDTGVRVGGPQILRLRLGDIVAAVRLYDGKVRTSLCRLDVAAAKLTEALPLPSGGDTSYAGLGWHDDRLWVSYYSSHEGKSAIYLAEVNAK